MLQRPPALPSRKPLRSSPLAGLALSPNSPAPPTRDSGSMPPRRPRLVRPSTAPSTSTYTSHPNPRVAFQVAQRGHSSGPASRLRPSTADPSSCDYRHSAKIIQGHPYATTPSKPVSNEWMTANTYATTPRFSRLGLAGSGVVLPVSARGHNRKSMSHMSSSSSLSPQTELGRLNNHSLPSLARTRTHSATSFKDNTSPLTPSSPVCNPGHVNPTGVPMPSDNGRKVRGLKSWKSFSLRTMRSTKALRNPAYISDMGQISDTVLPIPSQEEKTSCGKRTGTIRRILKVVSKRFHK